MNEFTKFWNSVDSWRSEYDAAVSAWFRSKYEERERIKKILEDAGTYCNWNKVMEAIDK